MNQGMYRPGPSNVPSLPFPRSTTWIGVFTALIFTVAVLGILVTLAGFARDGMASHWRAVKEGGMGMYLLLLFAIFLPPLLAVVGAMWMRGKGLRMTGSVALVALVPFVVASANVFISARRIERILASVNGAVLTRIVSEAISELSNLHALGDLTASLSCAVVAIGAAGALATIDAKRVSPNAQGFAKRSWIIALVIAALWCIAILALTAAFFRKMQPSGLTAVAIASVIIIAFVLVVAARGAAALRDGLDAAEARTHLALAVVACVTGVISLCLFEHALVAREQVLVLGAVSGESVDASQKARILAELLPVRSHAMCAYGLHALFGAAILAVTIAPAIGASRGAPQEKVHPWTLGGILGAASIVVALAFLLLSRAGIVHLAAFASPKPMTGAGATVKLPNVLGVSTDSDDVSSLTLIVQANGGATWEDTPRGASDATEESLPVQIAIVADARASLSAVLGAIDAKGTSYRGRDMFFVARVEADDTSRLSDRPKLGDLAMFLGSDRVGLPITLVDNRTGYHILDATLTGRHLEVRDSVSNRTASITMSELHDDAYQNEHKLTNVVRDDLSQIHLGARPNESVANVADALALLDRAFRYRMTQQTGFRNGIRVLLRPIAK